MDTTINDITLEMTGKTVTAYPYDNHNDIILHETFKTQTEALDFYFNQIEEL